MPPFLADFISDLEEQGFFSLRQVPSLDFPEKGLEQIVGGKSFPLVCGCLLAFQRLEPFIAQLEDLRVHLFQPVLGIQDRYLV